MTIRVTPARLPAGEPVEVPLLGRGRHAHPRKGGCLMELVSAAAGGLWSDRPACTPPVLAHIARVVNDHTSSADRPRLAALIPYLITKQDRAHQDLIDVEAHIDPEHTPAWLLGRHPLVDGTEDRLSGLILP